MPSSNGIPAFGRVTETSLAGGKSRQKALDHRSRGLATSPTYRGHAARQCTRAPRTSEATLPDATAFRIEFTRHYLCHPGISRRGGQQPRSSVAGRSARNGSSQAMCASITCPGRANPCCGVLTPCVERFTQPTVVTASIGEPCPLTIPSNSSEWKVDRETRSLGPCHPTGTPEAHFQAHRDGPATEFCARSSLPVN